MKKHVFLFTFFLSVFLIFSSGHFGGDGLDDYLTAESIVLDRDLSIYDRPFNVPYISYPEDRKESSHPVYSPHGLGMPVLIVPFYLSGHVLSGFFPPELHDYITQFSVSCLNPVLCALLMLGIFILIRRLDYSGKTAFTTVFILSLCTMVTAYMRSGFSEIAVSLFMVAALIFLFKYEQSGRNRDVVLTGIFISFAVFTKKVFIITVPFYLLYLIFAEVRRKSSPLKLLSRVAWFLVPLGIVVLVILTKNRVLYGALSRTEYGNLAAMADKASGGGHIIKALYYYFVSSGKGFFFFNPPLILGLFVLPVMFRKHRAKSMLILSLVLVISGFYVNIFTRGSLFSWGPRYLFTILPLLSVFLAEFISSSGNFARKAWLYVLAFGGFLVNVPSFFINTSKYLYFVKEKLMLDEYMINFIPDLSPLKGAWALFISAVQRLFSGESLTFTFSPDVRLGVIERAASLQGYDVFDIWWINVLKVKPDFIVLTASVTAVLLVCIFVSLKFIKSSE